MAEINEELANSRAARMLADGLQRASQERGLSIRKVGALLRYKQAVVLSHMALGRTPIPIDRAEEIATVLELDKQVFLSAVVEQRHPEVNWSLLAGPVPPQSGEIDELARDLEAIAGQRLEALSPEQQKVLREVVADPHPARRWLSVHEVPVIQILRKSRPGMDEVGLSRADRDALERALGSATTDTPRVHRKL